MCVHAYIYWLSAFIFNSSVSLIVLEYHSIIPVWDQRWALSVCAKQVFLSENSFKPVRQSTGNKELLNLQPACKHPGNGCVGVNAGLSHLHANTLIRSIFRPGSFSSGLRAEMTSIEKVGVMTFCCKVDYFCHIISFNSSWSSLQLFDATEHGALLKPLECIVCLLLTWLSLPLVSEKSLCTYKKGVFQGIFCVNWKSFWHSALPVGVCMQGHDDMHLPFCFRYFSTLVPFLSLVV